MQELITEHTRATYAPPSPIISKGFSKIWKNIRVELTNALTEMGKLNWMTAGKASRLYESEAHLTGHEIKDRIPIRASVLFQASFKTKRPNDKAEFTIISLSTRLIGPDEMVVDLMVNDVFRKENGISNTQFVVKLDELQKLPQLVKLTFAANKL